MNIFRILCVAMLMVAGLSGCAEIDTPTPKKIFKDPNWTGYIQKGQSKQKVVADYGKPTQIRVVRSSEWEGPREEWFYSAEYAALPVVNAGYLSKDLYVYFDGDNVTNVSEKPLGKAIEEGAK